MIHNDKNCDLNQTRFVSLDQLFAEYKVIQIRCLQVAMTQLRVLMLRNTAAFFSKSMTQSNARSGLLSIVQAKRKHKRKN